MQIDLKKEVIENKAATRFLGIILNNQLRGRMEKANNVLKYVSKVSRGPEMSTSLGLYKSLVRSTADYENFIYAPSNVQQILKLEKGQYLGLRTALGYKNSTSTNVIIAKS